MKKDSWHVEGDLQESDCEDERKTNLLTQRNGHGKDDGNRDEEDSEITSDIHTCHRPPIWLGVAVPIYRGIPKLLQGDTGSHDDTAHINVCQYNDSQHDFAGPSSPFIRQDTHV
jgi:hypothetical protein